MAIRSTMETLLRRLRRLIADIEDPPRFDDDELQDKLDQHRRDVYNELLTPEPTFTSAGAGPQYLDHQACGGDWAEDAVVQNASRVSVTPDTSDYQRGRFSFTTEPSYPLFLTGKRFDIYAAAADALEEWAASDAGRFDFAAGDQRFAVSQAAKGRMALAESYRQKAWPVVAQMVRTDVEPADRSTSYLATLRR